MNCRGRPKGKKQALQVSNFEAIARQWWEHYKDTWTPVHTVRVLKRMENNIVRDLGHLRIDEVTPKRIIAVIRKIEDRGALDMASRTNQIIGAICRFVVQQGIAIHNPAGDLTGIAKQRKVQHHASLPREELPEFLRALEDYNDRGRKLTQR